MLGFPSVRMLGDFCCGQQGGTELQLDKEALSCNMKVATLFLSGSGGKDTKKREATCVIRRGRSSKDICTAVRQPMRSEEFCTKWRQHCQSISFLSPGGDGECGTVFGKGTHGITSRSFTVEKHFGSKNLVYETFNAGWKILSTGGCGRRGRVRCGFTLKH